MPWRLSIRKTGHRSGVNNPGSRGANQAITCRVTRSRARSWGSSDVTQGPAAMMATPASIVVRSVVTRTPPRCGSILRRQQFVAQGMSLHRSEDTLDQGALWCAHLGDAGDMKELRSARLFEFAPELVGALQERHIRGMLEIGEADDPGCTM